MTNHIDETINPQFMEKLSLDWNMLHLTSFQEEEKYWSYKTDNKKEDGNPVQDPMQYVIIHHTASTAKSDKSNQHSVNTLLNRTLSVQYLIPREGEYSDHLIMNLVDDDKRAYHCGLSKWSDHENLNFHSIGIEINNNGIDEKFLNEQMAVLIVLLHALRKAYDIDPFDIISHHEIAPSRKSDPSGHFNWSLLSHYGVTYFPSIAKQKDTERVLFTFGDTKDEIKVVKENLRKLGYGAGPTYISLEQDGHISNKLDHDTANVIRSFKRKYMPETCIDSDQKINTVQKESEQYRQKLLAENKSETEINEASTSYDHQMNKLVADNSDWTEHCDLLLSDILKARENYLEGKLKIEFDPKKIEHYNPLESEFQKINSRYDRLLEKLGMDCFINNRTLINNDKGECGAR